MKKHYGPIVLGIIALTLAAPVSNATTVLAGETTGSESTTEQSNSSERTESKNQTGTTTPTTDEYSGKTDLILQRPDQPAPGLYKISDAEFTFSKLDTYENQLDPRVYQLAKKEVENSGKQETPQIEEAKPAAPKKKVVKRRRLEN